MTADRFAEIRSDNQAFRAILNIMREHRKSPYRQSRWRDQFTDLTLAFLGPMSVILVLFAMTPERFFIPIP